MSEEEKKIIIDEDWKSQVQAEKEAAEVEAAKPDQTAEVSPTSTGDDVNDPPMPPASIGMLMSSLATEAMISLGAIPHPATGETVVRRNQAKYLIDTIDVLNQKTTGNLSSDEATALEDVLHQLRMAFVATAQKEPDNKT